MSRNHYKSFVYSIYKVLSLQVLLCLLGSLHLLLVFKISVDLNKSFNMAKNIAYFSFVFRLQSCAPNNGLYRSGLDPLSATDLCYTITLFLYRSMDNILFLLFYIFEILPYFP